jgi:hypothetical protein
MERQPLDSLKYESTYLELRPDCERLADTTDASLPARRRGDQPVHGTIDSYGIAPADTGIVRAGPRTVSAPDPLPSRHRARYWTLLGPSLSVVVSASLGIVAELDVRAARSMFVALTGVLLGGWARLAWRGTPSPGRFDAAVARLLDRLVTALGTFFAIALWAEYAPQASVAFSKTGVLVMGGVGLSVGLVAAARHG